MKHFFTFFSLFSLLFLVLFVPLLPSVSAGAGITGLEPIDQRTFFFKPYLHDEFTWKIHRSGILYTSLGGNLAEYGTIIDPNNGTGERYVTWSFTLPETLEPGEHDIKLQVIEGSVSGGMVGGRAGVSGVVKVISLYPEPYIVAGMRVRDIPNNSSNTAVLSLQSWFEETIDIVYADVIVTDNQGNELLTTQSPLTSLNSREKKSLEIPLETNDFVPGVYTLTATVYGAQEDVVVTKVFRVGVKSVALTDYTKKLLPGTINKFTLDFESNWNEEIPLITATVTLGSASGKTAPEPVGPFASGRLEAFLDLSAYNASTNITEKGTIDFYVEGKESTSYPIAVKIALPPPELEEPRFTLPFSPLIGVYFLLALLVVVNLALLFRKKPSQTQQQPTQVQQQPQQPNQQSPTQQPAQPQSSTQPVQPSQQVQQPPSTIQGSAPQNVQEQNQNGPQGPQ